MLLLLFLCGYPTRDVADFDDTEKLLKTWEVKGFCIPNRRD